MNNSPLKLLVVSSLNNKKSEKEEEEKGEESNMIKSLLVSGVVVVTSESISSPKVTSEDFSAWITRHDKHYKTPEEHNHAFTSFVKNIEKVNKLNNRVNATWVATVENQFGDLSSEEFKEKILSRSFDSLDTSHKTKSSNSVKKRIGKEYLKRNFISSDNESFDWTDYGAVTHVQDQGTVGTCWAFSTIGNVEGQWYLSSDNNDLVDLSEEFLVDCDGSRDDEANRADCGVFGGWPYLAYQFLIDAGGVPTEESYPYCCGTGDCYPCMNGPVSLCGPPPYYCDEEITKACPDAKLYAKISDWYYISSEEEQMKTDLEEIGPLSALLDATQLQYYESGVWEGKSFGPDVAGCSDSYLNHAVLVTGFGLESNSPYWRVKNSWGEKWGEDGYFRIERGTGMCGINTEVTTSTV